MRKGELQNDSEREENLEKIMSWEASIINRVALPEFAVHVQCSVPLFALSSMASHIFIDTGFDFIEQSHCVDLLYFCNYCKPFSPAQRKTLNKQLV